MLGVPYEDATVANADIVAQKEALALAQNLEKSGASKSLADKEIIPLIAYLQALGQKPKINFYCEI